MVCASVATLALAGCGSDDSSGAGGDDVLAAVKEDNKLQVGIMNDLPWSAIEGDEATGLVPDLIRAVFERAGVDVELEPTVMPFDSLIPSLESGKIQMIGTSIYATEERDEVIDFSRILFYNPPTLAVQEGNPDNLADLSDLCGKVGATYKGTTFVDDLEAASKECSSGSIEIKQYDNIFAVMQDVAAGRVDGGLIDAANTAYALNENPDLGIELAEDFVPSDRDGTAAAVGISEGNQDLLDVFNPAYDEMLADGTAAEIFEKYGMTPPENWLPQ